MAGKWARKTGVGNSGKNLKKRGYDLKYYPVPIQDWLWKIWRRVNGFMGFAADSSGTGIENHAQHLKNTDRGITWAFPSSLTI